jgi:hypothetical protein
MSNGDPFDHDTPVSTHIEIDPGHEFAYQCGETVPATAIYEWPDGSQTTERIGVAKMRRAYDDDHDEA